MSQCRILCVSSDSRRSFSCFLHLAGHPAVHAYCFAFSPFSQLFEVPSILVAWVGPFPCRHSGAWRMNRTSEVHVIISGLMLLKVAQAQFSMPEIAPTMDVSRTRLCHASTPPSLCALPEHKRCAGSCRLVDLAETSWLAKVLLQLLLASL